MRFPFSLQQRTSSGQLGFFSSFSTLCWTRSGSSNSLYRSMSLCLPRSIRLSTCGLLSSYCSERSPGKFGGVDWLSWPTPTPSGRRRFSQILLVCPSPRWRRSCQKKMGIFSFAVVHGAYLSLPSSSSSRKERRTVLVSD